MALSDIVSFIDSEKDRQVKELKELYSVYEKELIENANLKKDEYSVLKFKEFESIKLDLEKKQISSLNKYKRMKESLFKEDIVNDIFFRLSKDLKTLNDDKLVLFFSKYIISISEKKGTIVSLGASKDVLVSAIKKSNKNFLFEEGKGDGGFLFKGDGFVVDFSLKNIVFNLLYKDEKVSILNKLFS
jgi:vacuolar-type H+-ATPase subunit E/Vma4